MPKTDFLMKWLKCYLTDPGSGRVIDFDKLEGPETNRRPHLTILDEPKFPIILEESDTKTGLSGPALVIKPGVLKQGWTYIVELKIRNKGMVKDWNNQLIM